VAEVERVLRVELIPKERLAAALSGEGAVELGLGGVAHKYLPEEGWRLVSHTFETRAGETAIFTMLFERQE
jgi:hypothetical protein